MDPTSARQQLQREEPRLAQNLGRQTFSGHLVRIFRDTVTKTTFCIYYDSRADHSFAVPLIWDKCPSGYIGY